MSSLEKGTPINVPALKYGDKPKTEKEAGDVL
jgi:hypothetical protein